MTEPDYYRVLGIDRDASEQQIKRAYRNLAKRYHPDRNQDDPQATVRFKRVLQAYEVLSDLEKRAMYDRFGRADFASAPGGGGGGPGGGVGFSDFADLFGQAPGGRGGWSDVVEQFVGRVGRPRGRAAHKAAVRGGDIERDIQLTFDQAVEGTTLSFRMTREGSTQTLDVRIPQGVSEGQRIRLRGKGGPGVGGGGPGDVYIVCRVAAHRYFERRENDIYLTVPISITEAALGARVTLPTLNGMTTVTIPAGTASGRKLRLKGQGVFDARSNTRGDEYVVIRIVPPKQLDDRQRELAEALAEALAEDDPRRDVAWR